MAVAAGLIANPSDVDLKRFHRKGPQIQLVLHQVIAERMSADD